MTRALLGACRAQEDCVGITEHQRPSKSGTIAARPDKERFITGERHIQTQLQDGRCRGDEAGPSAPQGDGTLMGSQRFPWTVVDGYGWHYPCSSPASRKPAAPAMAIAHMPEANRAAVIANRLARSARAVCC